jgi:hypothetical protein
MPPLDFPNPPLTTGQTYAGPNNIVWQWDGAKWGVLNTGLPIAGSLPLTGGTISGNLAVTGTSTLGTTTVPTMTAGDSSTHAASTAFVTNAIPVVSGPTSTSDVGRNLLHNGLLNIKQRTSTSWTANGGYTADRWRMDYSGATISVSYLAFTDAYRAQVGDEAAINYLSGNVSASGGAGDFAIISQRIESLRRTSGKTVTVSLYASSPQSLNLGVCWTQGFGTGGSPSASVTGVGQMAAVSATTWARYSFTFNIPSISGMTLGTNGDDSLTLELWYSSGTNFTVRSGGVGNQYGIIRLWGIQLEVGTAATQLEKLDPRLDLANCQRFYVNMPVFVGGYTAASNNLWAPITLPVTMRAAPTTAFSNQAYSNASALTANQSYAQMVTIQATVTTTGGAYASGLIQASADL